MDTKSITALKGAACAIVLGLSACATTDAPSPVAKALATSGRAVSRLWRGPAGQAQSTSAEGQSTAGKELAGEESAAPRRTDTFPLPPIGTNVVGEILVVRSRYEDTLLDIARDYDLGYKEIVDANPGVDPWLPGEGTRVVLPTQFVLPDAPRKGIVLNVSAMRLFYYPPPKAGQQPVVITHPIGIGREGWDTPLAVAKVIEKIVKPKWRVPDSIRAEHARDGDPLPKIVRPGPDNPLGDFAMRLSIPAYLIHGTNQPYGIGRRVSHGCIQMYPEDIAQTFSLVAVGTPVSIVDQPYLVGRLNGLLYLKAHEPEKSDKRKRPDFAANLGASINKAGKRGDSVDWNRVKGVLEEARGIPIPIVAGSPDLSDLLAAAPETKLSVSSVARTNNAPEAPDDGAVCGTCRKTNQAN